MVISSPLRPPAFCDGSRPAVATSEQFAYLGPRASWPQPLHGSPLDRVEGLVARREPLAGFDGGAALREQVINGCYFGDFRLQGLRERICHGLSLEVNTPVFNGVLTGGGLLLHMEFKPTVVHHPKAH